MKTRKALVLSLGVAIGFAGGVAASERDREDATADGAPVAKAPVDFKVISPGVVTGTWNGKQVQLTLKAVVSTEEAIKESGSIDRYLFDQGMRNVPSMQHNGETVYMKPVVANYDDLLGPAAAAARAQMPLTDIVATRADFDQRFQWVERTIGGETVRAYQAPVVINDTSMFASQRAQHMAHVRSLMYKGQRVFLSGVVFPEDVNDAAGR